MRHKLWVRLTLAFLLVALAAVVSIAILINAAVEDRFRGYIDRETSTLAAIRVVPLLETYFAENGTWEGAETVLPGPGSGAASEGQGTGNAEHEGRAGQGTGRGGVRYTIIDAAGRIVIAPAGEPAGGLASADLLDAAIALEQDGEVVGWLVVETPGQSALSSAQADFLSQVQNALIVVTVVASLLALVVGVALSRVLSKPLYALAEAARAVARGSLGKTVPVQPGYASEIAGLTESFNQMSLALAAGEEQRQRMAADIAHELRTPLSVMRGQLQAMMDEVRPPSMEHIAGVYDQTLHLARLVEDLRTLTLAESGHLPMEMQACSLSDLLLRAARMFEPLAEDASLTLRTEIAPDLAPVRCDPDRMMQVLGNLLANALRHTTPGGDILLMARPLGKHVRVAVSNTGVTLTPEQAGRVFDRFWRADESRSRDRGGSGLGLSISREIVRLHGGDLRVELEPDRTSFVFELPIA